MRADGAHRLATFTRRPIDSALAVRVTGQGVPVEVGVMAGAGPPRDVVQGEDRTAEGESLPFGAVQLLQRAGQGGRATAGPPALLGGTR